MASCSERVFVLDVFVRNVVMFHCHDGVVIMQKEFDMQIKDMSAEEKSLLIAALDLAIASCERRGNRAGEVASIKEELAKHAEKYRMLKSSVSLTK